MMWCTSHKATNDVQDDHNLCAADPVASSQWLGQMFPCQLSGLKNVAIMFLFIIRSSKDLIRVFELDLSLLIIL